MFTNPHQYEGSFERLLGNGLVDQGNEVDIEEHEQQLNFLLDKCRQSVKEANFADNVRIGVFSFMWIWNYGYTPSETAELIRRPEALGVVAKVVVPFLTQLFNSFRKPFRISFTYDGHRQDYGREIMSLITYRQLAFFLFGLNFYSIQWQEAIQWITKRITR
jgi:hypothetical protein